MNMAFTELRHSQVVLARFSEFFLAVSPVMLKQRYGSQGCLSVRYVAYACPQTVLRILRKVANHPNSTSD